jgi:SAM-dependent methyltransferase
VLREEEEVMPGEPRVADAPARPVAFIVDADREARSAVQRCLDRRFGADYRVLTADSAGAGLRVLRWHRVPGAGAHPPPGGQPRPAGGGRRSIALLALHPGERVLIVGAGTGLDLPYLPRGVAITAVDLTPAMVEQTRHRAASLGLAVEADVMDAQRLAFPPASFDAVILHLVVAVVPDPVACLSEAARVLVPGGRAVVFDKFVPEGQRPSRRRRLANLVW